MNPWSKVFSAVPVLALCIGVSVAQIPPKREFRGAWIATVSNIDWPSQSSYGNIGSQQSELITLLDSLQRLGINAVMLQIRPSCDAFYKSTLEPWSQWLNGTQGLGPTDSNFDPLAFAIAEAHVRGMELHAWFNPYRAVQNTSSSSVSLQHISVQRADLVKSYPIYADSAGKRVLRGYLKMLDPGIPEVRSYVTSVILDVVRRYDIDGVHFDDYFYPYPTRDSSNTLVDFPDSAAYDNYNPSGLPKSDWRRDNVNIFVKMVSDSVKAVKPKVKFGISPFGIWKNSSSDPLGSATNGLQSYYDIYCDSRKWLLEAWIDYCAPQIYWNIGYSIANYSVLVPWWNTNAFARHIYVGQGTYRMVKLAPPNDVFPKSDWPPSEIINQIKLNRDASLYPSVFGSIHFSAKYFRQNLKNINDSLRLTVYSNFTLDAIPKPFALLPTMAWKDDIPPNIPDSLKINPFSSSSTNALVTWQAPEAASDGENPQRYVLYRSTSLPIDTNDVRNIAYITTQLGQIVPKPLSGGQIYYYAVTALDRLHNESSLSNIVGLTSTGTVGVDQEAPFLPATFVLHQNYPNPFNPGTVISFTLPGEMFISLRVYDILGRLVRVMAEAEFGPGTHHLQFDGSGFPSGVYFYRFVAGGFVETKKMQLIK